MSHRKRGFSLIELLIVIAIILIIMGMALGPLQQAKMQALEAGAINAVKTIHAAQAQYQSQYGRYASTLVELGPPATGSLGMAAAGLIGSDLAKGEKSGYRYTLQATEDGYTVNADPVSFNSSSKHTFYSDQTLILRQNSTKEPATAASPEFNPR